MRTLSAITIGVASLVVSTVAIAQSTPAPAAAAKANFAGKWVLIPDSAGAPAAGGRGAAMRGFGGLGAEAVIVQDEKTVTITRTIAAGTEFKTAYNLDGSPSTNSLALGTMGNLPLTSTAKWDGAKFVTNTSIAIPSGQSFELTMTLLLDGAGNLVVESTTGSMTGGAPTAATSKYKKG